MFTLIKSESKLHQNLYIVSICEVLNDETISVCIVCKISLIVASDGERE